jgi:hypothetical protein
LAQAVRWTVPVGVDTSLNIFCVDRNLYRVIVIGTRTARERPVATIREIARRTRMERFNCYTQPC